MTAPKKAKEKLLYVLDKFKDSNFYKDFITSIYNDANANNFQNVSVEFSVVDTLAGNIHGQTSGSAQAVGGVITSYPIKISINQNSLLSQTYFEIASTLMHETLHAYLHYVLKANGYSELEIQNLSTDDDYIANLLNEENILNNNNDDVAQHNFFITNFIPQLTAGLLEMRDLILTPQQIQNIENFYSDWEFGLDNDFVNFNWQDLCQAFTLVGLERYPAYDDEYNDQETGEPTDRRLQLDDFAELRLHFRSNQFNANINQDVYENTTNCD